MPHPQVFQHRHLPLHVLVPRRDAVVEEAVHHAQLRDVLGGLDALVRDPHVYAERHVRAAFAAAIPRLDVLVNNAGNAFGGESIAAADEGKWRAMFELNVLGTLRVTRALLDKLLASGDGLIVNVGSIAGFEVYPGGAGYTASKHALRALTRTLRLELLGRPVRVTDVAPGMAETEFALVRFGGDAERARRLYEGMTPLTAEDIAAAIAFVATRPPHVDIDEIVIRPRDQASATLVHRRPAG